MVQAIEFLGLASLLTTPGSFGVEFMRLLGVILAFLFVLFLAYFSIRLMGRAKMGGFRGNRNVKIIEIISVGPQNTIQLVSASGKYFLVGVSRNGITLLGEISADDVVLPPLHGGGVAPFEKYLSRLMPNKNKDKDEN